MNFETTVVRVLVGRGSPSAWQRRSRIALGFCAGGALAYVGSALCFVTTVGGASLLFVPLGVLLVSPSREGLATLPLACGIARLGCLWLGCCYESASNALPELCGHLALHLGARRWPRHTAPIVLCGFGAIRLLSLPLRRELVVEPSIDPAWIAGAWIVAGVVLRNRIGSAADAGEWFTERTEPLLRALVVMLLVWLLLPLAGEVFEAPSTALVVGSSLALLLLLALRRPVVPRVSLRSAGVGAVALVVGIVVASLAEAGFRHVGFTGAPQVPIGFTAAIATVAIAPVFEELLYRERLLGTMRSLWGGPIAVVASSALFALGHVDPRVMPIAFAGGVVCAVVMLRTGSLAAVIGLHAGWNLGLVASA